MRIAVIDGQGGGTYIWKSRPEIIEKAAAGEALGNLSIKKAVTAIVTLALITGVGLSWLASANPDGLEWAMIKTAGTAELEAPDGLHQSLAALQTKTAFLPGYSFRVPENAAEESTGDDEKAWPAVSGGTSTAGLVGGGLK